MVEVQELFKRIVERCQGNLSRSERAKLYLHRNEITNESVLSAFRVGVADDGLLSALGDDEKTLLRSAGLISPRGSTSLSSSGLLIPTFDPREPESPVGFIKQFEAQNKHAFVSVPRGVACGFDIGGQNRVVIVDTPLLGLRLAQFGVNGVVIAETPEVVPPLGSWFRGRALLIASHKQAGSSALKAALEGIADVQTVLIPSAISRLSAHTLEALGVNSKPAAELTQSQIVELVQYAQARLAAGDGLDLLRQNGCDCREFIETYGVGYLPENFHDALPQEFKSVLSGKISGGCLIVPAMDNSGIACDVACVGGKESLFQQPAGLIAPKAATSFEHVLVTDSFSVAAMHFAQGKRNVLLMRGVSDARANAERLALSVKSAEVISECIAEQISTALEAAGSIQARISPLRTNPPSCPAKAALCCSASASMRRPNERPLRPPTCLTLLK